MNQHIYPKNITIDLAKESDWNSILKLLEETNLIFWLSKNDSFKNFYIVRNPNTASLLGCFAIDHKDGIGILKSFAISKDYQGKGLGKLIANKTKDTCKKAGIERLYAASVEAPDFWRKTFFREINPNDIKDKYAKNYSDYLREKLPEVFNDTAFFVSEIND